MYPCPMLHSYYQRCENQIPRRALNRMIDQAMLKDTDCRELDPPILRLNSLHPECYAPHVDVTRAKCAFGRRALPKLRTELHSEHPRIVRQAVNTIADLIHNPESVVEAIRLRIPDRLADLLVSEDPFLRERIGMIYTSLASQSNGGSTITGNPSIVCNLVKNLRDDLDCVRLRAAEAIEMLARNCRVAQDLCAFGFIDLIVDRIIEEKKDILVVYLETLKSLLDCDQKIHAIEIGTMDKLVMLLQRKDEDILVESLACLAILCSHPVGKQKSIDMDLLFVLKTFLEDERRAVHTKAAGVVAFVTITTPGKLRALDLQIMGRLLELAADFHCRELQLMALKALTNIAEVPRGRAMMLQSNTMFIENIDTCKDEATERHKAILMETIRWQP
ncbi:radial spoke head 14 homolog [Neodiprion fabricii]|uniref:radial spoke head 14 homolog n=1 Tax=Neodiprion fabricii TaxID=2872261 RepID=UPI001ED8E8F5|nr:radial spoke head 14 homolog [Neodiprion fabricii]